EVVSVGGERGTWSEELMVGVRLVCVEQTVLALMVTAALYSLAASAFAFMLPVFAEQNLSVGALELGALWSALGAGMLAASTWLASLSQGDLHGRFTLIFRSMMVGGLAMCGLSLLTAPLIAGALILIIGGGNPLFMPIVWGVLQEVATAPLFGRGVSTLCAGAMASAMAGRSWLWLGGREDGPACQSAGYRAGLTWHGLRRGIVQPPVSASFSSTFYHRPRPQASGIGQT